MAKTQAAPVPTREQDEILKCIERAAEQAGQDNREFIRLLNQCYAGKSPGRTRSGTGGAAGLDRTGRIQQLLQDERYLRNARELARRTQGGTRVIGGTPVPKKDFLDCVAVGNDQDWGCTGTLIAPNVVVTAGHCIGFSTRVFFGHDVDKPGRAVDIASKHRHPDYRKAGKQNDIMILVLSERLTNIKPRSIATGSAVDTATDGRVVGFGNTDPGGSKGYGIKRQVDVPIASPSCSGTFQGQPDAQAYGCDIGLEIVAGKPLLAKDSCTGDSGGPFYIEQGGKWALAGATSRATNQSANDCGDGGVYVRVERYLDWIGQLPGVTLPTE